MARMKDRKNKAKKTTLRIPGMKDVEGKRPLVAEGEYTVEVVNVEEKEGQNAPYLAWEFKVVGGKFDGAKLYNNTSLAPQALWNLRGTLEALGVDVPDDDEDMELEEFVGKTCGVEVSHEMYDGKKMARITDIHPAAEEDDGDGEDDEEAPASKRSKKRDEDEDDEKPAKSSRRGRASRDDDGEEDEEPRGKASKKGKKKPSKLTKDEVMDMSQDELEDVIKEHELETDLSDYATLRKMKAAVVEALEEAGALEE